MLRQELVKIINSFPMCVYKRVEDMDTGTGNGKAEEYIVLGLTGISIVINVLHPYLPLSTYRLKIIRPTPSSHRGNHNMAFIQGTR